MSCEQTTNYIEYRCEACTLFIALVEGRILAESRSEAPGSTRPGSSVARRMKADVWQHTAWLKHGMPVEGRILAESRNEAPFRRHHSHTGSVAGATAALVGGGPAGGGGGGRYVPMMFNTCTTRIARRFPEISFS